ncbi:MAG: septum formation initiator family protein [Clostridia bacterium]|jgi:cell division protein FtsB|nr:septum formation initiator family protein [Clostridia bacterium]
MKKNQKKKGSFILRFAAIALSVYMIFSLCTLWQKLAEEQNSLAQLEKIKAEKTAQIEYLSNLLESGNEKKIIEKAARERLGYVYADEQIFIDVSGN